MTTQVPSGIESSSATASVRMSWRAILFAPIGDDQRRRRGSDAVRLILASLAVLCAVLVLRSNSHPEDVIAHVLSPPPYGIRWLVTLIWIGEISSATEAPIDRSLLVAFVELVQSGPSGRVADIGCGPGRVAALLARSGLDAVGVDVSEGMLAAARKAHPRIPFEKGGLAALPFESEVLAGAVCWYSIIYTPPERLGEAFRELERVLVPGGHVLLGFQAGSCEPIRRQAAHGTNLPLTNYLHNPSGVAALLEEVGFTIFAQVVRAADLEHETSPQGFVVASRPVE